MSAGWSGAVVAILVAAGSAPARAADPPPSTAAVTQLAVVSGTTCALHADGNVSCWGRDLDRSRKEPPEHARPVGVPAFHDVVQLEGVFFGICARYGDGTVKCLGMTPASTDALEAQPLADVVQLRGTCARLRDGHASCFDGKTWVAIPGVDDAVDVSGGDLTGCAVHPDTTVSCWTARPTADPAMIGAGPRGTAHVIPGVTGAVQVAAGLQFGCARLRDGHVSCWGNNAGGELGRDVIEDDYLTVHEAQPVLGVSDAVDLLAGAAHACIRRKAGPLACWGDLPWENAKHPHVTPIKPLDHVTAMAGGDQTCAVGKGRDVWCMGVGTQGELGNGVAGVLDAPVAIPGVHDATQLLATTLGTCAVRKPGAVTCWGEHGNGPGKLHGIRRLSESSRAFSGEYLTGLDAQGRLWVDGEDAPRKLPAGVTHAGICVVTKGGAVWCNAIAQGTGKRVTGQLAGVGDAVELAGGDHLVLRRKSGAVATFRVDTALAGGPATDVAGIDDAIGVVEGASQSCAVRADHTLWCWGDRTKPEKVAGVADVASVAIAEPRSALSTGFGCAVKVDGTVACWGDDRHGQLGDGTRTTSATPVATLGVTDAVQVVTGALHACALQRAGTVLCWGSTEEGAGGLPPTRRVDHPVAVRWP